jgi:hypothetical protein
VKSCTYKRASVSVCSFLSTLTLFSLKYKHIPGVGNFSEILVDAVRTSLLYLLPFSSAVPARSRNSRQTLRKKNIKSQKVPFNSGKLM